MRDHPLIVPFEGDTPDIDPSAFIAPMAVIIGKVTIGPDANIWYNCVLRGDENHIEIGAGANIQDGTIIHVDHPDIGGCACVIGANALIGHKCMLHGATVKAGGFVGMGATMLDHAVIESGAMLAAGAFLSSRKTVPTGELWGGMPARKMRDLKPGEDKAALIGAAGYVREAARHRAALEALAICAR